MVHPTTPDFGGSLVGVITNLPYSALVAALGEPNSPTDGYKTDAEWAVELEDGRKAAIYNYKDGKSYLGEDGRAVEDITSWHVGAEDHKDDTLIPQLALEIFNQAIVAR